MEAENSSPSHPSGFISITPLNFALHKPYYFICIYIQPRLTSNSEFLWHARSNNHNSWLQI